MWSIMQSLLHNFCKHSKLKSIILHCSIEKKTEETHDFPGARKIGGQVV